MVGTLGGTWEYQNSPENSSKLSSELPQHYQLWQQGKEDKSHPFFLVLSGPGTGKSRLLDEFPEMARQACNKQKGLSTLLQNAFVFNVTFENGTRLVGAEGSNPSQHIGTRMMWQLHRDTSGHSWEDFWTKKQYTIGEALSELSRVTGTPRKAQCVMVLVDGMQHLDHTPGDVTSVLSSALSTLANFVNAGPEFFIAVAAATIHTSMEDYLRNSKQNRVHLTPSRLDGFKIFPNPNRLERMLIGDMGGHGRALEMLAETLNSTSPDSSFETIVTLLRAKLVEKYGDWFRKNATTLLPIFEAVLARRRFPLITDKIYDGFTVEDATLLGMITWDDNEGTLCAPFILFWLMSSSCLKQLNGPLLGLLSNIDLPTEDHRQKGRVTVGLATFHHLEEFVLHFRALKSKVFAGKNVSMGEFHAGAKLSPLAQNTVIHVREQQSVRAASQQRSKSDGKQVMIRHEHGEAVLLGVVVLNGPSASAADVFTSVALVETGGSRIVHETFACRLRPQEVLSQEDFDFEHNKAANKNDIFLFIHAGRSSVDVNTSSCRVGLVDRAAFNDYFGPFAQRAMTLRDESPPNINTAPRSVLESIVGIGPVKAAEILKSRPFRSIKDAREKGLGETCLQRLSFD